MMTMTIAHWKLVVQVRRQPTAPASDALTTVVRRAQRRQLDHEIARTRDRAEAWRLLGGPTPR